YKNLNDGQTAEYRIVGVDEANITQGKISFLSPLSKVLLRKKKGDIVTFKTPSGEMRLEILGVR
ncbi:MAG: GreA/GreB family elongation factor, partial [Bacteroidales bacterium]|nr:GreA/GreB family elongation factor [Bacteroidales bacterium]